MLYLNLDFVTVIFWLRSDGTPGCPEYNFFVGQGARRVP